MTGAARGTATPRAGWRRAGGGSSCTVNRSDAHCAPREEVDVVVELDRVVFATSTVGGPCRNRPMQAHLTDRELLTPQEVAELLRCSPRTVRRYAAAGVLPVVRLSPRNFKYRTESVAALIAGSTTLPRRQHVPRTSQSAAIDVGDVRSQFIADLAAGRVPTVAGGSDQDRWWARSLRLQDGHLVLVVDDGDGRVLRLPVTASPGGLSYGQPELMSPDFIPVAASASGDGQRVLASWPERITPPQRRYRP